jgi:hypothetical protein
VREHARRTVFCPPLVPAGPIRIVAAGPADFLDANYYHRHGLRYGWGFTALSPHLRKANGGHWEFFEYGRSAAAAAAFISHAPWLHSKRLRVVVRREALAGTRVTVYGYPPYAVCHCELGGHDELVWRWRADTIFSISVHGYSNVRLADEMMSAHIAEVRRRSS